MDTKGDILDKIQKLTSALYRVTDLLSDKEPLKWILRDKSLKIYNNLLSLLLSEDDVRDKNELLNKTMNSLSQVINLLGLASDGTSISSINFKILEKEYNNLKSFVEGKRGDIVSEQKLLAGFTEEKKDSKNYIRHSIGHDNKRQNNNGSDERKGKIINILKNQGSKTISEISSNFQGISEKTIQRDLIYLAKNNKVKTEGERRWRKYIYIEVNNPAS